MPKEQLEQLELFDMSYDDRIERLTKYLKFQVAANAFRFPTAKQILEIGEKFGVQGRKPLIILEDIWRDRSKWQDEW